MDAYYAVDRDHFAERDKEAQRDLFIEAYVARRFAEIMADPKAIFDLLEDEAESLTMDEIHEALGRAANYYPPGMLYYMHITKHVRRVVELEADAAATRRDEQEGC